MDERLSWPRWLAIPRWFTQTPRDGHLSKY